LLYNEQSSVWKTLRPTADLLLKTAPLVTEIGRERNGRLRDPI